MMTILLANIPSSSPIVIVDMPAHQKPLQNKWVFKIKSDIDGKIKYKARLVAKDYTQQAGIDDDETFSPVIRKETLRLLFAVAAQYDMQISHLDEKTAFLNGELSERIARGLFRKKERKIRPVSFRNHCTV